MKALDPETILRLGAVILTAIGTRAHSFVALLMTSVLFCWAMYRASWLEFTVASAFCIGVLWPVLLVNWYGSKSDEG